MAVLLAVLASLALAIGAVLARRGGLFIAPSLGARLTILVGIPMFAVLALAFGELRKITSLPLIVYFWFALAGIVHFILGRSMQYTAFQQIGAARATIVITVAPLISVAIAAPVFDEEITPLLVAGASLVIAGPILIAREEARMQQSGVGTASSVALPTGSQLRYGVILSLMAAAAWGVSPIFVKAGLNREDVPVLGLFISYLAAGAVVAGYLSRPAERREFGRLHPTGLRWFIAGGVAVSLAQGLRYIAFSEGDVAVVALMLQLVPVFVFILTAIFNRRLEALSPYVLAGAVLVVAGSAVVAVSG